MNIDPQEKMITKDRIEKYILRKAFDVSDEPGAKKYLPDHILYRQKEQFSDGVGYGWIDALKDNAEIHVSDEMMKNPKPEWGSDIPDSKEAFVTTMVHYVILTDFFQLLVSMHVRRALPSVLCRDCDAVDSHLVQTD